MRSMDNRRVWKYNLYGAVLLTAVNYAFGAGNFFIMHAPPAFKFYRTEYVDQSVLKEVFSLALGYSIEKENDWNGMSIKNPFHYAEALVNIVVDGVPSLEMTEGIRYELNTDEDEEQTWQALASRVERHFCGQNKTLLRVDLNSGLDRLQSYEQLLGNIEISYNQHNLKALDPQITEDSEFLTEINVLENVAEKVESGLPLRDGTSDVFWFVVRGLHPINDLHGPDSDASKEAQHLLVSAVNKVNKSFVEAYAGRVLLTLLTTDVSHTRITRSLMQVENEEIDYNLSKEYSLDYPVIFNIILWFGIIFIFSLLAISLHIAEMDPGRDSIIYRMTSTRMKKDN